MSAVAPEPIQPSAAPEAAPLPTVPRRLSAQTLDVLAGALIALVVALLLRVLPLPEEWPGFVALALFLGYVLLADGIPGGSAGKRVLGMEVVGVRSGSPCLYSQSVVRNITHTLGPMDWVWALQASRRRLGDHLAGTQVVFKNRFPFPTVTTPQ